MKLSTKAGIAAYALGFGIFIFICVSDRPDPDPVAPLPFPVPYSKPLHYSAHYDDQARLWMLKATSGQDFEIHVTRQEQPVSQGRRYDDRNPGEKVFDFVTQWWRE